MQIIPLENFKYKISYIEDGIEKGYIIIEDTKEIINIIDVLVLEEYRQNKIASKIFEYLLNNYKNVKFMLEVRTKNTPAINLYKKYNFKIIHTRKNYYKDDDAYIMEVNN